MFFFAFIIDGFYPLFLQISSIAYVQLDSKHASGNNYGNLWKTLVLLLFLKLKEDYLDQDLFIILDPRQFEYEMNIRDTKTGMSGMNTEHLQYNEQEQNLKTFWPTRTLQPMPKFYWLTTPMPFKPKFYGPTLLTSFLTHATRAKIWTTPPMLISWP